MTEALVDIDARPDLVLELTGTVVKDEAGKLVFVPDSESRWLAVLGRMVGRPVTVAVSREKLRRSPESNRYLWKAVYQRLVDEFRAIAQDAEQRPVFNNKNDVHDWCKYRFLGLEVVKVGNEEIERPSTTTKLTVSQFSAYIQQIKQLVADRWQIYIED